MLDSLPPFLVLLEPASLTSDESPFKLGVVHELSRIVSIMTSEATDWAQRVCVAYGNNLPQAFYLGLVDSNEILQVSSPSFLVARITIRPLNSESSLVCSWNYFMGLLANADIIEIGHGVTYTLVYDNGTSEPKARILDGDLWRIDEGISVDEAMEDQFELLCSGTVVSVESESIVIIQPEDDDFLPQPSQKTEPGELAQCGFDRVGTRVHFVWFWRETKLEAKLLHPFFNVRKIDSQPATFRCELTLPQCYLRDASEDEEVAMLGD